MSTFEEFPKIARLSRNCVITEKIDGTNAQVYIEEISPDRGGNVVVGEELAVIDRYAIYAGSKSRWLAPTKGADNFGFAAWVKEHAEELMTLGPGRHFGEWWGSGVQRGYGLQEKRLSLFNVRRWGDDRDRTKYPAERPACCHVVPVVYTGIFTTQVVEDAIVRLAVGGSLASPGFFKAEGVVIWHEAAGVGFKKTLEKDEAPKGAQQ